jgi:hypothetical protein
MQLPGKPISGERGSPKCIDYLRMIWMVSFALRRFASIKEPCYKTRNLVFPLKNHDYLQANAIEVSIATKERNSYPLDVWVDTRQWDGRYLKSPFQGIATPLGFEYIRNGNGITGVIASLCSRTSYALRVWECSAWEIGTLSQCLCPVISSRGTVLGVVVFPAWTESTLEAKEEGVERHFGKRSGYSVLVQPYINGRKCFIGNATFSQVARWMNVQLNLPLSPKNRDQWGAAVEVSITKGSPLKALKRELSLLMSQDSRYVRAPFLFTQFVLGVLEEDYRYNLCCI